MKIWHQYFLKEFFKIFFLFLICFYGLYCLIDYSGHTSSLNHNHGTFGFKDFFFYYLSEFSRRYDIIIPFGLLLATTRTLLLFNTRSELVALMAGGYRLRTLLTPFLLVGLVMTLLSYMNEQWVQPTASGYIKSIEHRYALIKSKKRGIPSARAIPLAQNSLLVFKEYHEGEEIFKDLFWIISTDKIYRIGTLKPFQSPPEAYQVELIERQPNGFLMVTNTFDFLHLEGFTLNKDQLMDTIIPPSLLPLTELWQSLPTEMKSEKEAAVITAFTKKMVLPWLSFFAILVSAPFCVRFGRQLPTFLIYATTIFALIALYLILDAGEVIAKRQLLPPLIALIAPLFLAGIFPLWKYLQVR